MFSEIKFEVVITFWGKSMKCNILFQVFFFIILFNHKKSHIAYISFLFYR